MFKNRYEMNQIMTPGNKRIFKSNPKIGSIRSDENNFLNRVSHLNISPLLTKSRRG
jgi:hypothetical protein